MRTPAEVRLRCCVTLEKGKPPAVQPYYGPDADGYLTPDNLRTGEECALVKAAPRAARVENGDTVLLWDGSNAGEVFFGRTGILASTMSRASHAGRFDNAYFFYALKQWEPYLKGQTAGSGIPHIDKEIFGNLAITEFDLREQTKIAEVLSTVDLAIEETEALIAKQQRIKAGLMQDLLTRGIDEHGNLRSEETHEFRDSTLGRIPAEWDVAGLSARKHTKKPYLKTGPFGSSLKTSDWVEQGIPVITIGALGEGSFDESGLLHISMAKAQKLAAYALEPGDIVFSRVADVGRSVVVTERERDWIMSSNMMRISIDVAKGDPDFLRLNIVRHPSVRAQIRQTVNASGREVANQQVLDALQFPWPSVDEQRRMVRIIAQQSEQIQSNEACLAKFRRAKAGLMQDLLTGSRPVTVLLEQREEAT